LKNVDENMLTKPTFLKNVETPNKVVHHFQKNIATFCKNVDEKILPTHPKNFDQKKVSNTSGKYG
jgi:hypothetical protein